MLEHALIERYEVHTLYVYVRDFLKTDRSSGRALSCGSKESEKSRFRYSLVNEQGFACDVN